MILITGGAGYIGGHTVIEFLKNDCSVLIFDNLENGQIETIEELKKIGDVTFEKGDLRNKKDLETLFSKYQIDAVIHFAAFALVEESVLNPEKYYINNVVGTLNLLETMRKFNVKNIVFSSSCATYGEPQYTPIDETHPQKPINPYGNSKLMVETILKDYDKAYNLKSIILRYFNVAGTDTLTRIGETHNPETHLIPKILKSSFEGAKTFKIYGNDYNTNDGTCVRDYVNVEDLAIAHRLAYEYLKKENKSNIFNIGTEKGQSVKEVFEACEKVINKKINKVIEKRRSGDPAELYADTNKAQRELNWAPSHTLEDSILSAYNWELKQNSNKKA